MFIYCANAERPLEAAPSLRLTALPDSLRVRATFGLTVLSHDLAPANALAMTILSPEGQATLARHGFEAPLLAP